MHQRKLLATALVLFALKPLWAPVAAHAQAVEVQENGDDTDTSANPPTTTGRDKAKQYFQKRTRLTSDRQPSASSGATPHFLAVHIGRMFADEAYRWAPDEEHDVGRLNAGVTYRLGEWVNSFDVNLRMEYTGYSFANGDASQVSFTGLVTFPDANSRFPLYFGLGLGPGFFVKQVESRSSVALDYQVVVGARFLDVLDHVGFMVESGMKNLALISTPGQYNGVFVNVGTVFAF